MDAQVTRSMFDKAMPHITRAIEHCHFYAFDLEMTGLHVSDQRESWIDDMEDRYRVVRLNRLFCSSSRSSSKSCDYLLYRRGHDHPPEAGPLIENLLQQCLGYSTDYQRISCVMSCAAVTMPARLQKTTRVQDLT